MVEMELERRLTMTLQEAIENLQDLLHPEGDEVYPEVASAVKLGIEAMKRIREKRLNHWVLITPPLPGETEE